jgi:DHA2 family multidrug resistance protein
MSKEPRPLPISAAVSLEWQPAAPFWLLAPTVILATFMEVLDTSIVVVSLPQIAGSLSSSVDEATWVLTSYLVSNAIVLPTSAWLSDVFGRKRFFMICIALFVGSSMLCGLSTSLAMLIFFRVLQGLGGGALQPISQAILLESSPGRMRGMAMAVFGMGVVVAPIIGPTLGGWITDNYTWRWVFFINLPVGAVALLLTLIVVEDPPYVVPKGLRGGMQIDYIGLALLSLGLGCLQVVLDRGQRDDWFASDFIFALAIISGVTLVLMVVWELWVKQPVLDLRLLKERNFLFSTIVMFVLGFVLYGSIALLPILLQTLMGYTAFLSGLVLSPGGVLTIIALPVVGLLLRRVQARWLIVIGMLLLAWSLYDMAQFNLQMGFWNAVWPRAIQGLGLAFLFVPINVAAFHFIAQRKTNYATGIINLARNIGGSSGIAFATTVLARHAQFHYNVLIGNISELNPVYRHVYSAASGLLITRTDGSYQAGVQAQALLAGSMQQQAMMLAFIDTFSWMAAIALITLPLLFLMKQTEPGTTAPPAVAG